MRAWRSGMTLLEVLMVIALGALVIGSLALRSARFGGGDRLERAAEQFRDLDGRARLLAARVGSAALYLEGEDLRLLDRLERIVAERGIGGLESIELAPSEVTFDSRGQTSSYEVRLQSATETVRLEVNGQTGWMVRRGRER